MEWDDIIPQMLYLMIERYWPIYLWAWTLCLLGFIKQHHTWSEFITSPYLICMYLHVLSDIECITFLIVNKVFNLHDAAHALQLVEKLEIFKAFVKPSWAFWSMEWKHNIPQMLYLSDFTSPYLISLCACADSLIHKLALSKAFVKLLMSFSGARNVKTTSLRWCTSWWRDIASWSY